MTLLIKAAILIILIFNADCASFSSNVNQTYPLNNRGEHSISPDILDLESLDLNQNELDWLFSSSTTLSDLKYDTKTQDIVDLKSLDLDKNEVDWLNSSSTDISDLTSINSKMEYGNMKSKKDVFSADEDYFFFDPENNHMLGGGSLPQKLKIPTNSEDEKQYDQEEEPNKEGILADGSKN